MSEESAFGLKGKRAVVTGAAQGIGYGIAEALLTAGAQVLLVDVNAEVLEQATKRLGAGAFSLAASVVTDATAIVECAVDVMGGLDIFVNNAGIFPAEPTLELSEPIYSRTLDVNLRGPMFCSVAAARQMIAQGTRGSVITIGSGAALKPTPGLVVYAASKAAVISMTKTMAAEFTPRGIRVNCILPGAIASEGADADAEGSEMTRAVVATVPAGRRGTPEDIANAVVFLASPAADYITGVALPVDGGATL